MRYFLQLFSALFLTLSSLGQGTITAVYFPTHMGVGSRVPYACRLTLTGLDGNKTYRFLNQVVADPSASSGSGNGIFVRADGTFVRVTAQSVTANSTSGQFTTNGLGAYTGWFILEPTASAVFTPNTAVYFRISLNDGNDGQSIISTLTSTETINLIPFSTAGDGGTGIRSTPATEAIPKNFVFLYANAAPAPAERPVMGTFIESDGISTVTSYAQFYIDHVNGKDKTWGGIIPNNLTNGIRRIAQYSLANGAEVGYKTSADGLWATPGGNTVSTVSSNGGLTNVIVLDGSIVTLGVPVAQPQTITFNDPPAKTYGEADFNPGAIASSQLPVTYTSSNQAVATILNGNTIHITGAGATDITAMQAGNTDFLAATPVVKTLTVNKANLTITAEDKVKVQGDPLPDFTATFDGFVPGENASVFTSPLSFSTTASPSSGTGVYVIKPEGAVAANYNIIFVNGKLTVTAVKQPQTITFGALPVKTYGDPEFTPGAISTSGLTVQYRSSDAAIATIVAGKVQLKGTGTVTITAFHPGDDNYEPAADVPQILTINKAALTIKADNKSRLVGQPNPDLTISYLSFVYNETNAVFTTQPTITTTATAGSGVGDYEIKVEGATAANYIITHERGTLTVNPLPGQTIGFPALSAKKYGDDDFSAGAVASSQLPVSYTSSNMQVAIVENGTIKIRGAGTTNITASQPGDAAHAPAPDVVQPLTVRKADLLIRALDTAKLEGQANPALEIVYSGFVKGEDASALTTQPVVSTLVTEQSVAGKYAITVTGAASNNYSIAMVNGTLRVYPALGASQDNMTAWISAPGQLQVNIHSVDEGKVIIQLFDQQGNRAQQSIASVVKGFNTHRLPVGNISPGIYHVRVYGPGFVLKHKLVIR